MPNDSEVSLKEYIESRLMAMERAITIADEAMNRRLEGMNEFRDTLRDQAARLATRDEVRTLMNPMLEDIRQLRESRANIEGKADQKSVNSAMLIALGGVFLGILGLIVSIVAVFAT